MPALLERLNHRVHDAQSPVEVLGRDRDVEVWLLPAAAWVTGEDLPRLRHERMRIGQPLRDSNLGWGWLVGGFAAITLATLSPRCDGEEPHLLWGVSRQSR